MKKERKFETIPFLGIQFRSLVTTGYYTYTYSLHIQLTHIYLLSAVKWLVSFRLICIQLCSLSIHTWLKQCRFFCWIKVTIQNKSGRVMVQLSTSRFRFVTEAITQLFCDYLILNRSQRPWDVDFLLFLGNPLYINLMAKISPLP